MSQQAKNEFYKDEDEMVMDYAVAVNAEAHDLETAGADIIQLDEPWLRNDPEAAKRIAVKAINRALEGLKVPTIVHLCFGYAALVPGETKPVGYSFLPQLADSTAEQISIEAAQPKLDLGVLKELAPKKVLLGVIDLNDPKAETPQAVAERIRAGLKFVAARQADPGARLRHEVSAARGGLRQAAGAERRRRHRAQGAVECHPGPCARDPAIRGRRSQRHDGSRRHRPSPVQASAGMTHTREAPMLPLLPTTLVGSYAQPDWLIDREKLGKRFPPRVRARELWRVAPEWLEQAQDDATLLAIRDQERAGLDIITDGEMRRESYSNRFATALDGVDIDNPGTALDRSGHPNPVPRVVGPDPAPAPRAGARRRVPARQHRPSRSRSPCRAPSP